MINYAKEIGGLCIYFDAHIKQNEKNEWFGTATIGNTTYFTENYNDRDCALSELKGYLEGLMIQMKEFMEYIDRELKKGE